jgi:hypothetical protein
MSSASLKQSIRNHIEQKMMVAQLETSPFPHLIIEQFFPGDVYQKIQEFNLFKKNRGTEWLSKAASQTSKTQTPYYARKQINFHNDMPYEASPEERAFWNVITDTFLGDHWFESLVYRKYPEYFSIRFGDLTSEPDFFALFRKELFLQRHETGYSIGPHTDIPTRIFTCIFSFADRPGFEAFGTQLLSHRDRLTRCWGNSHYDARDFVVRKTAPYSPNNILLFFKTRQSFHSVLEIDETVPNERYGMQFQFYEPIKGVFNDLSEPTLMHNRHKRFAGAATLARLREKIGI